jgi:hypothetical protein
VVDTFVVPICPKCWPYPCVQEMTDELDSARGVSYEHSLRLVLSVVQQVHEIYILCCVPSPHPPTASNHCRDPAKRA